MLKDEVGVKENIVVSHGRWDDFSVKNTPVMAETIIEFLKNRDEYRAVIFGSGIEMVKDHNRACSQHVKDRIEISGYIQHEKGRGHTEKRKDALCTLKMGKLLNSSG